MVEGWKGELEWWRLKENIVLCVFEAGRVVIAGIVVEIAIWLWQACSNKVLECICKFGCLQHVLSHVRRRLCSEKKIGTNGENPN